ncbi:hypothetical protein IE53DRAFT_383865 [Violaceomyces palustris]|uniref:Uncharacterized protein n=1 Tax=Violaceomyces palustris TaxID=1673888 RepID=A0ACD0P6K4_9BASI|nr:hypothetical protein IE53DRAFT_383865 [Violaceomyces palustris]
MPSFSLFHESESYGALSPSDSDQSVSSRSSSPSSSSSSLSSSDEDDHSLLEKVTLPQVPDLRFEQSYLATVRSFIHEVDHRDPVQEKISQRKGWETRFSAISEKELVGFSTNEEEEAEQAGEEEKRGQVDEFVVEAGEKNESELWLGDLRIEWGPLLYVTIRDQILSPLVQGALWGVAGIAFAQLKTYLQVRRGVRGATSSARGAGGKSLFDAIGLVPKRRP